MTKEQILHALSELKEPTFQHSFFELNLIRDVMIKEQKISLTIIMIDNSFEEQARIEHEIKTILQNISVQDVHIRFREISDFEMNDIKQKLNISKAEKSDLTKNLLSSEANVKFIAISSGKGGVGKSTVTVNLAVALARKGKKVGIIDADIYGFSIPDMMGIEDRPKVDDNKVIPIEKFGVKLISMGFFVEDNAPVIWRGPMLGKMLRNFFSEVDWGQIEYILLDMPPGTGDIALDVNQMIPNSKHILVTTPHATAAYVAARAGSMAIHTKHDILGVIENMSYYECTHCGKQDFIYGRGGGAKVAEQLNTELLAQIPLGAPDNHISEPDFSPSVYKEDSKTGEIYLEIADRICEKWNN